MRFATEKYPLFISLVNFQTHMYTPLPIIYEIIGIHVLGMQTICVCIVPQMQCLYYLFHIRYYISFGVHPPIKFDSILRSWVGSSLDWPSQVLGAVLMSLTGLTLKSYLSLLSSCLLSGMPRYQGYVCTSSLRFLFFSSSCAQ